MSILATVLGISLSSCSWHAFIRPINYLHTINITVVVKIIIIIIVVVMRSGEKAADLRMAADDQTALCIRVMVSMSAIVETPRPSSDTSGRDTAIYAETALYRVITLETQKKSRTFIDDLSGKINPNSP